MIVPEKQPILGGGHKELMVWIGTGNGLTIQKILAHHIAYHQALAIAAQSKVTGPASDSLCLEAKRNLGIATKFANALEVMKDLTSKEELYALTNLPTEYA
jgi:hypothetical protein